MNFLKSFKVISLFSYQSTFSFFCCRISDSSFNIPRRFRVVNNKFQIFTFYFFGVRQTFHTCINKHISQSMCKCPIMSRVNSISSRKAPQAPPSLVRVPVNSFEFHSCERTPPGGWLRRSWAKLLIHTEASAPYTDEVHPDIPSSLFSTNHPGGQTQYLPVKNRLCSLRHSGVP